MKANPAVGTEVLKEIAMWKEEGCKMEDVIARLRARIVPEGYEPHPWIKGE